VELLFETRKGLLRLDIRSVASEIYNPENENGFSVFVRTCFARYPVFGRFLYGKCRYFIDLFPVGLHIFNPDDFGKIFGIPRRNKHSASCFDCSLFLFPAPAHSCNTLSVISIGKTT
jgi:hypothetical protein